MLILFLCTILLSSNLIAGTIDPTIDDSKYVEYGKKFPNVVQVVAMKDGSPNIGSATVIKPNWAITSAHIVDGDNAVVFLITDEIASKASKVIIHKSFNKEKTRADVALIKLEKNMTFDSYPELYEDQNEIGLECSMSGYGKTGTFITGAIRVDGLKRAGKNRISSISKVSVYDKSTNNFLTFTGDMLICSSKKGKSSTNLDFLIAGGDSGGGLFIDGKLAGINCCILFDDESGDADYGDDNGFMRISHYRDWILENIEE
jgi:hypothetical protein